MRECAVTSSPSDGCGFEDENQRVQEGENTFDIQICVETQSVCVCVCALQAHGGSCLPLPSHTP